MNRLLFDKAVTDSQHRSERDLSHLNKEEDLMRNLKKVCQFETLTSVILLICGKGLTLLRIQTKNYIKR